MTNFKQNAFAMEAFCFLYLQNLQALKKKMVKINTYDKYLWTNWIYFGYYFVQKMGNECRLEK